MRRTLNRSARGVRALRFRALALTLAASAPLCFAAGAAAAQGRPEHGVTFIDVQHHDAGAAQPERVLLAELDAVFAAHLDRNGRRVLFVANDGNAANHIFGFAADDGSLLDVGVYAASGCRAPAPNPSQAPTPLTNAYAALFVGSPLAGGCTSGAFEVLELEIDESGKVQRFAADFWYESTLTQQQAWGRLRFRASAMLGAANDGRPDSDACASRALACGVSLPAPLAPASARSGAVQTYLSVVFGMGSSIVPPDDDVLNPLVNATHAALLLERAVVFAIDNAFAPSIDPDQLVEIEGPAGPVFDKDPTVPPEDVADELEKGPGGRGDPPAERPPGEASGDDEPPPRGSKAPQRSAADPDPDGNAKRIQLHTARNAASLVAAPRTRAAAAPPARRPVAEALGDASGAAAAADAGGSDAGITSGGPVVLRTERRAPPSIPARARPRLEAEPPLPRLDPDPPAPAARRHAAQEPRDASPHVRRDSHTSVRSVRSEPPSRTRAIARSVEAPPAHVANADGSLVERPSVTPTSALDAVLHALHRLGVLLAACWELLWSAIAGSGEAAGGRG